MPTSLHLHKNMPLAARGLPRALFMRPSVAVAAVAMSVAAVPMLRPAARLLDVATGFLAERFGTGRTTEIIGLPLPSFAGRSLVAIDRHVADGIRCVHESLSFLSKRTAHCSLRAAARRAASRILKLRFPRLMIVGRRAAASAA